METLCHTCLLIDDNPLDNYINSKILERNNFADDILISQYPEDVLNSLKDGSLHPDVIFLDIRMPVCDGFQFLNEYAKIDFDKKNTKIFILSSSIDPSDLDRAANNKYVTKYITKALSSEVLASLSKYI